METPMGGGSGLTLLIVDDSTTMRRMLRRAAMLSGVPLIDVLEAGNGQEALDILGRTSVDAVFTDINMPVMTGVQLLKRMAAESRWSHVLRVIISTDASDVRRQEVSTLHVRHYLRKPVRPETVCDVLTQLLASTR